LQCKKTRVATTALMSSTSGWYYWTKKTSNLSTTWSSPTLLLVIQLVWIQCEDEAQFWRIKKKSLQTCFTQRSFHISHFGLTTGSWCGQAQVSREDLMTSTFSIPFFSNHKASYWTLMPSLMVGKK